MLFLRFLRNLILAHILGIEDYNIWVIFLVVLTYTDLVHFGLRLAGDRDLPILNGTDRHIEALQYSKVLFAGILILSAICSLLLFLLSYLLFNNPFPIASYSAKTVGIGLYYLAFIVLSDQIMRYFIMLLRTKHRFKELISIELISDIASILLSSILSYFFSISGAIAGYSIGSLLSALYFLSFVKDLNKTPFFSFHDFISSISTAIPLFIANLFHVFILSIDRLSGTVILTKQEMSLFGFASQFSALPILAISGLRDVLYPSFGELSSSKQGNQIAYSIYLKSVIATSYIAAIFAAGILIAGDLIVVYVLPAFLQSLTIMYILSGAMLLFSATIIPISILFIYKKHWLFCFIVIQSTAISSIVLLSVQYIFHQRILSIFAFIWFLAVLFSAQIQFAANKSFLGNASTAFRLILKSVMLSLIFPSSYFLMLYLPLSSTYPYGLLAVLKFVILGSFLFAFLAFNKNDRIAMSGVLRNYLKPGKTP